MAEHTPGPWRLTHIGGTNFAVQRYELRGMLGNVPNVYPIFNKDTSAIDGGTFCASPENALLIAAAPELLEALEVMASFAEGVIKRAKLHDTNGIVAASRAAIAKAKGEV